MTTPHIRRLTALLFIVALAVAAPAAARTHAHSAGGHAVLGAGTFGPGCTTGGITWCDGRSFSFKLAAVSSASGSPAFGYFERRNLANGNTFSGLVTCLNVAGDEATVGGFLTQPYADGTSFRVSVMPHGISPFEIYAPGDPATPSGFPFTCPAPPPALGYYTLTSGAIVVR